MADRVVNTGFDPEFGGPLAKFRDALAAKGIDTNIISGVRSDEDQRQLVANRNATLSGAPLPYPSRGKVYVAAPVGSSLHERGLGADVQPANPADAAKMHKLAKQFGLEMPNWGGNDPYHVQLTNWQDAEASQPPNTPWGASPSRFAANTNAETPSSGGGFVVPGTTITIGGAAPIAGALSQPSTPTPGTPVNDFYHASMMHESGGKNIANAAGGRAGGYYQFMPGTWASVRAAHPELNLPANVMDANQDQQTAAYHEFTKGNVAALQGAGLPINDKNVFMASFLGGGGATNFLTQLSKNPDANAADLFPKEAKANPGVFYANGKPRSLQDVFALQTKMHSDGNTTGFGPDAAPSATASATPGAETLARPEQSWWGKLTQGAIDPETGKVDPNQKQTPLEGLLKAASNNPHNLTPQQIQRNAEPDQTALSGAAAPMARNTSPMGGALLPSVPQTYGQTLNSFNQPLTYNSAPPQAPQGPQAGLQGGGYQTPGMSLNSFTGPPGGLLRYPRTQYDQYGDPTLGV